jgi:hypothetical protein
MMEKSAQPGSGEGCTPTPFLYIYHHEVVMNAPAERADTLPLFLLVTFMYSVVVTILGLAILIK